jgi:phosphomevalonate kinase
MDRERRTPLGMPVVIAPGKVVLVGEYAVVEDCPAVVAAIARHARAQFVPGKVDISPLAEEVAKRAQAELGDVLAALPVGSAQVDDEPFRVGGPLVGLGSSAATSVAVVGALLEAVGLAMPNRRSLVQALAEAGRRSFSGRVGSGAGTLAATYGGLVQIARTNAASRAFPIVPPSGLRLVLFSAPPSITPQRMAAGIQRYARTDPAGFQARAENLRGLAKRFVDEINQGRTTGAIAMARKYGDEVAGLGVAARVPITNPAFDQAAKLAREVGGVAKPTGAGNGTIGVAMFATQEAADLFRRAGPPSIVILDGDLDRLGARCQDSPDEFDDEPTAATEPPTPLPEVLEEDEAAFGQTATVTCEADDLDTAPTTVAAVQPESPAKTGRRLRRRITSAVTIAGAIALVGLFATPARVRARLHMGATTSPVEAPRPVAAVAKVPESPPAPEPAPPEPTPRVTDPPPLDPTPPSAAAKSPSRPGKPTAAKRQRVGGVRSRPTADSQAIGTSASADRTASRAGKLLSDDF